MEQQENSLKKANFKLIFAVTTIVIILPLIVFFIFPKSGKVETSNNRAETSISSLEEEANKDFTSNTVINLSVAYINNNAPGKAVEILNSFLKKDSSNAIIYNNLGTAHILMRNYLDGIDACKKAIVLDSNFTLAKNNLKWGLDELEKTKKAINDYNGFDASKKDADYYTQLGIYHLSLKQYDSCIHNCELGLAAFPDRNKTFLNNIGTALVLKRQFSKALEKFNAVLALDPNEQLAKNNIAWTISDSMKLNK